MLGKKIKELRLISGLTQEDVSKLFKPFSMLERHTNINQCWSGLGLLIVKEMLESLDSKIMVDSKKGEGTSFYFDIKLSIDEKIKESQKKSENELRKPVRLSTNCSFNNTFLGLR